MHFRVWASLQQRNGVKSDAPSRADDRLRVPLIGFIWGCWGGALILIQIIDFQPRHGHDYGRFPLVVVVVALSGNSE